MMFASSLHQLQLLKTVTGWISMTYSNARLVETIIVALSMHTRTFWVNVLRFITVYCFLSINISHKNDKGTKKSAWLAWFIVVSHFTQHKSVFCVTVVDIDNGRVCTGVVSISLEALLGAVHPMLMRPESIFRSHFILVRQRLRFVPIKVIKTTGCHISLHTKAGKLGRKDRVSENP